GIEPATCGFGDPIRRVGECRAMSPHAGLPCSLCRLMSPDVAECRRSLGQILGQTKATDHPNFPWISYQGAGQVDPRWRAQTPLPPTASISLCGAVGRNGKSARAWASAASKTPQRQIYCPYCLLEATGVFAATSTLMKQPSVCGAVGPPSPLWPK